MRREDSSLFGKSRSRLHNKHLIFTYACVSSGSIAGKSATLPFNFFWTFSKNRHEQKVWVQRGTIGWMDGWMGRDLFGWARKKVITFYHQGSMFFPKREETPAGLPGARMDRRTDRSRARHEIHEGRVGAWPHLAQLVVDGES